MPAVDPHLIWACGHGVMLLSSAVILLQTMLFRNVSVPVYKLGFTGALVSYSIVILKSLGVPQLNIHWVQRAFVDENVQYAVLALYWWISTPVNLTVLPFATFSLFHCLTFLRQNVLPRFAGPAPAPGPNGERAPPQGLHALMRRIHLWVKNNYDQAMRFVAFAELLILARVTLGALTFKLSFIAPIFLAHFIRLRYHASPFTKQAVNEIAARLDGFANSKGGAIANVWMRVKGAITAWGGGNLVPPQGAQGQGAAGPAQANAQAGRR